MSRAIQNILSNSISKARRSSQMTHFQSIDWHSATCTTWPRRFPKNIMNHQQLESSALSTCGVFGGATTHFQTLLTRQLRWSSCQWFWGEPRSGPTSSQFVLAAVFETIVSCGFQAETSGEGSCESCVFSFPWVVPFVSIRVMSCHVYWYCQPDLRPFQGTSCSAIFCSEATARAVWDSGCRML